MKAQPFFPGYEDADDAELEARCKSARLDYARRAGRSGSSVAKTTKRTMTQTEIAEIKEESLRLVEMWKTRSLAAIAAYYARAEAAFYGLSLKWRTADGVPISPKHDCDTEGCGQASVYEILGPDGATVLGYACEQHLSAAVHAFGAGHQSHDLREAATLEVAEVAQRVIREIGVKQAVHLVDLVLSKEMSREEVAEGMRQIEAVREARRRAGSGDVELYKRNDKRGGNGHG